MKKDRRKISSFALWIAVFSIAALRVEAAPLRIFIRAGIKTHALNQHDHPRFLHDWSALLSERGATVQGELRFPTAAELAATDVLVMYAQDAGNISPADRAILQDFLARGGGLVALHDAVCGSDAAWFKTVIGGAYQQGKAKYFEGPLAVTFTDRDHAITRGAVDFSLDDELYHAMEIDPAAHILATAWTPGSATNPSQRPGPLAEISRAAPQMWVYENRIPGAASSYRAFVSILGHWTRTFGLPRYRALVLRGIAWAGHREKLDELVSPEELAALSARDSNPSPPATSP